MTERAGARPGGRSARVQEAVHQAVRELEAEGGRGAVSVPAIAARAGVTPSTIYRRWGDLASLLADVAVERLRPDGPPADHGGLRADLEAWAEQFAEEMGSPAGRRYLRDAVAGAEPDGAAGRCSDHAAEQLRAIGVRAAGRGEAVPGVETLLDAVVAPLVYRILFRPDGLSADYARSLVRAALKD
ncbi:TetR/AcrR family transcriptional regulator [Kitasatospora sp. NPDC127111]|uniref:TetR/AcrR family transcriptional regulator n=1 Tax=Kitasatospora sp. NPDC127111 TaxID=3345363 RepID=UPI0036414345